MVMMVSRFKNIAKSWPDDLITADFAKQIALYVIIKHI
jgi:hypothetical protein